MPGSGRCSLNDFGFREDLLVTHILLLTRPADAGPQTMAGVGDKKRLQELQDELLALKNSFPQLKLHKTAANKSAAAPFPITLLVPVAAPSSAERYDVNQLDLKITVNDMILADPPPLNAIDVAVVNADLPTQLCLEISRQLHNMWATAAAAAGSSSSTDCFRLQAIIHKAQHDFVQFITLLPQFLEPYQATDASGATQRRYAIVMTDEITSDNAGLTAATASSSTDTASNSPSSTSLGFRTDKLSGPGSNSIGDTQHMPPPPPAVASVATSAASIVSTAKLSAAAAPWSPNQVAAAAAARGLPGSQGHVTPAPSNHDPSRQQQKQQQQHAVQQCNYQKDLTTGPAAADAPGGNASRGRGRGRAADAGVPPQWRQQQQQRRQILKDSLNAPTSSSAAEVPYRGRGRSRGGRTAGRQAMHNSAAATAGGLSQQQPTQQPPDRVRVRDDGTASQLSMSSSRDCGTTTQQGLLLGDRGSTTLLQSQQQLQVYTSNPTHSGPSPHAAAGLHYVSGGMRGRGRGRGIATSGGSGIAVHHHQQHQMLPGHVLAQQDLAAVQRRYGSSFRFQPTPQQQQKQQGRDVHMHASSHTAPVDDHHHDGASAAVSTVDALGPQHFSIMLRPTDPQWGSTRGALLVTGVLNPSCYPGHHNRTAAGTAAGSTSAAAAACGESINQTVEGTHASSNSSSSAAPLTLTVNPSRGVTAAEVYVLQSALDQELQRELGRAWQLRSCLKWLENYAGSTIDECFRAQQELLGEEVTPTQQQQQQQHRVRSRRKKQGSLPPLQAAKVQQKHQQTQSSPQQAAVAGSSMFMSGGIKILRAAHGQQQQQQQQQGNADAVAVAAAAPAAAAAGFEGYRLLHAKHDDSSSSTTTSGSSSQNNSTDIINEQELDSSTSEEDSTDHHDDHRRSSGSDHGSRSSQMGSSSDSESTETSDDSDSPEDEVKLHGESLEDSGSSSTAGYAVTLEGLKLDNIGVLEVVQAQLQLTCNRCDAKITVVLTAEGGHMTCTASAAAAAASSSSSSSSTTAAPLSRGNTPTTSSCSSSRAFGLSGICTVCNSQLDVLLRPRFVHEGNNILAGLKCVGCSPLDLLPSVYGATCADCDAVGALRNAQVGVPAQRNCGHCHRPMSCNIPAASFIPRGPHHGGSKSTASASTSRRDRAQRKGGAGGGVLMEGSPLPNKGACRHYRHSYRWLRFPCCGQRFPCDLCHEEAVADGHDAAWATRMVCGFCSREQRVDKSCKYCGKKLAASAAQPSGKNTRFWEGGKGCRDARMLDRRDAHKYRNSKSKTKSAKASRVGPKPWSGGAGASSTQPGYNSS